jgi:flagellar protein FliS
MSINKGSPFSKSQHDILRDNVMTASKEELTLMLYDGALKFINQAILAIEAHDVEKAHTLCTRAQSIILEFRATLDMEYDVSHQMEAMYIYIYELLLKGNMKKDVAALSEARDLVRGFRDTWKEAMLIARKEIAKEKESAARVKR